MGKDGSNREPKNDDIMDEDNDIDTSTHQSQQWKLALLLLYQLKTNALFIVTYANKGSGLVKLFTRVLEENGLGYKCGSVRDLYER